MAKEILDAIYHIALFKRYTDMSRQLEVLYGILWWFCVIAFCYIISNFA